MKKSFLILCLTVLPLWAAETEERFVENSFNVNDGVELVLDNHKGEIHIATAQVSTIEVKARIYTPAENRDSLDFVDVRMSQSGNRVRVSVDYDNKGLKGAMDGVLGKHNELPAVDFHVVMPDNGSLKLESHKATIDIDAPSGTVDLESHKGTGRIRNVRSDLRLETHKGKFDVEILNLGDVNVETHKGDVTLKISGAQDFDVRGESHKGHFVFEGYDIPVERKDGEIRVNYSQGSGTHRIDLETHKGEIRLEFLN